MIAVLEKNWTDKRETSKHLRDNGFVSATALFNPRTEVYRTYAHVVSGYSAYTLRKRFRKNLILRCVCIDYGSSGKSYWYYHKDI